MLLLLCFIMFKPTDVLPSPVGPLSKKIQYSSIAAANKHIREVKSATWFGYDQMTKNVGRNFTLSQKEGSDEIFR